MRWRLSLTDQIAASLVMSMSFVGNWGAENLMLVPDLLCLSLCRLERAAQGMVCLLMHACSAQ